MHSAMNRKLFQKLSYFFSCFGFEYVDLMKSVTPIAIFCMLVIPNMFM